MLRGILDQSKSGTPFIDMYIVQEFFRAMLLYRKEFSFINCSANPIFDDLFIPL